MTSSVARIVRILVVDDHALVRQGLTLLIKTQPDLAVAGEVGTAREAIAFLRQHEVDVVLLDIRLPDEDGLVVLSAIRVLNPRTGVLILSSHDGEFVIGKSFEGGALGYVSKVAPAPELIQAIRDVAAGKRVISHDLSAKLADHMGRSQLKPRELEILELVAQGLSNHEIGRRLGVSEKTIKNQLTILFEKLDASDRTHAVMVAIERGLIELAKG